MQLRDLDDLGRHLLQLEARGEIRQLLGNRGGTGCFTLLPEGGGLDDCAHGKDS
ncbi:hypothetical protein D3C83_118160 [compost metagenome]